FRPAFKLWLAANDRPHANAQDAALWRRVLLIPFTRTVPESERNKALKEIITSDPEVRAAILAWAVRGCLEWQQIGLQPPEAVRVATKAYRDACDDVGRFLSETYDPAPRQVTARHLRSSYTMWCQSNGEKPLPANRLGEALRQHGLTDTKSGST